MFLFNIRGKIQYLERIIKLQKAPDEIYFVPYAPFTNHGFPVFEGPDNIMDVNHHTGLQSRQYREEQSGQVTSYLDYMG